MQKYFGLLLHTAIVVFILGGLAIIDFQKEIIPLYINSLKTAILLTVTAIIASVIFVWGFVRFITHINKTPPLPAFKVFTVENFRNVSASVGGKLMTILLVFFIVPIGFVALAELLIVFQKNFILGWSKDLPYTKTQFWIFILLCLVLWLVLPFIFAFKNRKRRSRLVDAWLALGLFLMIFIKDLYKIFIDIVNIFK